METSIDCAEDQEELDEIDARIAILEIALAEAETALTLEDDDGVIPNEQIAELQAQLDAAIQQPISLENREFNVVLPNAGTYDITLNVTDGNSVTNSITQPVLVGEPIFQIPVPEILEPGFDDNTLFDGSGNGRDSWEPPFPEGPERIAWSPTGIDRFLGVEISESNPLDGEQSAKISKPPTGVQFGNRLAYQEIDVTPGASYILSWASAFSDPDDGEASLVFKIINPNTTNSFADAMLPENIIAERVDSNVNRVSDVYSRSAMSFDVGDLESVIILAYLEGEDEVRFDAVEIIVNQ